MGCKVDDQRPSWDSVFLRIAETVAERGTCPRAKVGAVVVVDRQIVSIGYNGAPRGQVHCLDAGCIILSDGGCGRSVHAEVNAIIQAGQAAAGATLYVTMSPCFRCSSVLVNAKIARVVYRTRYRVSPETPDPLVFLRECGVELVQLERV